MTRHEPGAFCEPCEARAPTRNNYFTGKLMLARDFEDEQRFFREKLRIHHLRLHGWGVVCGLRLRAHEPPCDTRYVILDPGSAVDCCGRDILVAMEEVIDLEAFEVVQDIIAEAEDPETPDDRTWDLRFCLSYVECPDEDVPVLYDECGCDDGRVAPNRILESWRIEVELAPPPAPPAILVPGLDWTATLALDAAAAVAVGADMAFVVTAGASPAVYAVALATLAVVASDALPAPGQAVALSADHATLFVVAGDPGGAADADVLSYDLAGGGLAAGPADSAAVPGSAGGRVALAVIPGAGVLALVEAAGAAHHWPGAVSGPPDGLGDLAAGGTVGAPVLMSDGITVLVPERGTATLHRLRFAGGAPALDTVTLDAGQGDALALVASTGPDRLAVADAAAEVLAVVDPETGVREGAGALAAAPVAVAVAPGGGWAYALLADGDTASVQAVDLAAVLRGEADAAAAPLPVLDRTRGIVLARDGRRLFLPALGPAAGGPGGVAVIAIEETDCRSLLLREDCPACGEDTCLTLATIRNWRPGDRILDRRDPPEEPEEGTAQIDNDDGRRRLPSTQAIADALLCLIDGGCGCDGEGGEQGPPGPQGPAGPAGAPGQDGQDAVLPLTTRICGISWEHLGIVGPEGFPTVTLDTGDGEPVRLPGLAFAFDRPVTFFRSLPPALQGAPDQDILRAAVRMVRLTVGLVGDVFSPITAPDFSLWAEIPCAVMPARLRLLPGEAEGTCRIEAIERLIPWSEDSVATGEVENGLVVFPGSPVTAEALQALFFRQWLNPGSVQVPQAAVPVYQVDVLFDGAGLLDTDRQPIDADHTAPGLQARPSGTGWPGGVFRSSFYFGGGPRVDDQRGGFFASANLTGDGLVTPAGGGLSINSASRAALLTLPGIGPEVAEAILARRPFASEAELQQVPGLGRARIDRLRDRIRFD